jgi:hypothetical protein
MNLAFELMKTNALSYIRETSQKAALIVRIFDVYFSNSANPSWTFTWGMGR